MSAMNTTGAASESRAAPTDPAPPEKGWDFPRSRSGVARHLGRAAMHAVRDHRDFRDLEHFLLFVGYPHSGSSLVGSLLNSHPEVVVSHEADILRYVRPGIPRALFLEMVLEGDRRFADIGRRWMNIDYDFAGTCQGAFVRLRVAGDKKAQRTAQRVQDDPAILERLRHIVGVPLRVLHISRNPFDNITSLVRRPDTTLSERIDHYGKVADAIDTVQGLLDESEFLALRYESVLADPAGKMAEICRFVGVDAPAAYRAICQAMVEPGRGRSRDRIDWSPEARHRVEGFIAAHAPLAGYSFDD